MVAALKPYLPTALLLALIGYFAVNLLTGERGLLTGGRLEATLAERTKALDAMQAQTRDLQAQVRLLSTRGLSKDMLEERARLMLGYADPNDYVIRTPSTKVH